MKQWVLLACAAAGCGRIDFDPRTDGATDSATPPADACVLGPWSAPVELVSVDSQSLEYAPALTDDGLDLIFISNRPGGAGMQDLYEATRTSTAVPFDPPIDLAINTAGYDDGPSLSADGLTLYFCSSPNATPGPCGLQRAKRLSRTDPWGAAQAVSQLPNAWGPFVTRAGDELFYSDLSSGISRVPLVGGVPGTPEAMPGLNGSTTSGFPTLSRDSLTIWVESSVLPETSSGVYTATRSAIGMPFGSLSLVSGVDSTGNDADPDVSNYDRTLVFSSDRSGGTGFNDLYISTRTCL